MLREHNVVPTEAEREASIREQVAAIEEKTGLVAELPAKTMAEVVNLAEFPTVMVGEFDELFLAVPKEITVDAMLVHQRYFPLFNADGTLANKFLITSNGDPKFEANIVDGNQRVVAARLYDAKFFYDEDLKRPLEDYVERLDTVVFQEKLGTTRAKTDRIVALAKAIAADAGATGQEAADAERAAYLAKADLVTGAVVEFTSVQGIMGSYYAKAAGETDAVARAIADHYRPRFSGDDVPAERVGCIVAIADKLDTICGLFAIGQGPTGSSDPFALRRSALGIVTMLLSDKGLDISLGAAIDVALASYAAQGIEFDAAAVRADVVDFFITRTKVMAKDEGAAPDAIDAVLAVSVEEPVVFMQRVRALVAAREQQAETFDDLATAYARANNLRDEKLGTNVDESLLGDEERALLDAVAAAEGKVAEHLAGNEYAAALAEASRICALPSTRSSTALWSWTRMRRFARTACACSTVSSPCSKTSPISAKWLRNRVLKGLPCGGPFPICREGGEAFAKAAADYRSCCFCCACPAGVCFRKKNMLEPDGLGGTIAALFFCGV